MSSMVKIVAGVLVLMAVILGIFALRLALKEPEPAPSAPAVAQQQAVPDVSVVKPAPEPELYPVVVAARDIAAGVPLQAEDLRTDMWPVTPNQGFTSTESLIGESLRDNIKMGEPLTERIVALGLSRYLQEGERAVTVPVSDTPAGRKGLMPGDKVDIFFTLGRAQENDNTQARLLLPAARVLAVGNDTLDGPIQPEDPKAKPAAAISRNVILAVPLEEVNPLLLAIDQGTLQLALRAPVDTAGLPDRSLFAERDPVLPLRKDLSEEDKARLKLPENLAYAGESVASFSGSVEDEEEPSAAPNTASGVAQGRTVQVIRGRQSGLQPY